MAAAILSFGVIGIIQPSVDETLANPSQNVNLVYSIFIAEQQETKHAID
jgi:hypothetical protein